MAIDHSAVWKENVINTEGKKSNKTDPAPVTETQMLRLQLGVTNLCSLLLYDEN